MSPSFYLGAYWGIRAASVDECAERLATMIEQFAHVDPLLTSWRQGAGSKRKAIEQPVVTSDHTDLVTRLLTGRNRRDTNRQVIDELGYSVSWWNGNPDASIGLSVGCGQTSPYVTNSFVLNLPKPGAGSGHLYNPGVAAKLLNIVVDTWQPDHAVWTNHDLVDKQRQPDRRLENGGIIAGQLVGHPAGWANFLSDSDSVKFDMALLPAGATVERLGTGTLVLL
ncbi:Imm52 family immunity protein, partial [Mycobacterium pseudokansasii]